MDFEIDHEHAAHNRLVRPYMVTRGRTDVPELSVETMVVAEGSAAGLADEHAAIHAFCHTPVAIAEIASSLDLPLGITRVLTSDLLAAGHLKAFSTARPSDASIVRRILNAISR